MALWCVWRKPGHPQMMLHPIDAFCNMAAFGARSGRCSSRMSSQSAMPETRVIQQTMNAGASMTGISKDQAIASPANSTTFKVHRRVSDTAPVATFLASNDARMMTETVVNSSPARSGFVTNPVLFSMRGRCACRPPVANISSVRRLHVRTTIASLAPSQLRSATRNRESCPRNALW